MLICSWRNLLRPAGSIPIAIALSLSTTQIDLRSNSFSISTLSANAGEIDTENLDGVPFSDRLVFSRIGSVTNPPANGVHNIATVRVRNPSSTALQINGRTLTGPWELLNALPSTIGAGGFADLRLRFRAGSGAIHNGTLVINSNDANEPNKVVQLSGFWQSIPEGGQEPTLQEMGRVFGYGTQITGTRQQLDQKGLVQSVGDEILAPYWQRANASQPVTIQQLAAYHAQDRTATVYWHNKGSNTANRIFAHAPSDAQTLLPRLLNSATRLAKGSFNPSGTFGLRIDGTEWSDPVKNDQLGDKAKGCVGPCGHHVRFWRAENPQGQAIPNTWLMSVDYSSINYDHQDNVYLITNAKPEPRTTLRRIDVGATTPYTDRSGDVWSPDTGLFSPSAPNENAGNVPIANTEDDRLYQTYRGRVTTPPRTLTYNIPNISGNVEVRLYFAEPFWGAPGRPAGGVGKRVFDVTAEGRLVMDNYDITQASGGALNATVVSIRNVQVNDNTLTLALRAEVDNSSLAAIRIMRN